MTIPNFEPRWCFKNSLVLATSFCWFTICGITTTITAHDGLIFTHFQQSEWLENVNLSTIFVIIRANVKQISNEQMCIDELIAAAPSMSSIAMAQITVDSMVI